MSRATRCCSWPVAERRVTYCADSASFVALLPRAASRGPTAVPHGESPDAAGESRSCSTPANRPSFTRGLPKGWLSLPTHLALRRLQATVHMCSVIGTEHEHRQSVRECDRRRRTGVWTKSRRNRVAVLGTRNLQMNPFPTPSHSKISQKSQPKQYLWRCLRSRRCGKELREHWTQFHRDEI